MSDMSDACDDEFMYWLPTVLMSESENITGNIIWVIKWKAICVLIKPWANEFRFHSPKSAQMNKKYQRKNKSKRILETQYCHVSNSSHNMTKCDFSIV